MDALDLSAALLEMYTLFRNRNDVDDSLHFYQSRVRKSSGHGKNGRNT